MDELLNLATGQGLVQTTYGTQLAEPIDHDMAGYVRGGLKGNGVIFGLELKRLQVFTQVRFQFQRIRAGRPGDLFGTPDLGVLERPWPGGVTSDLLAQMLLDADFAGNSYTVRVGGELVRLRPDWVDPILAPRLAPVGVNRETVQVGWVKVGYAYYEGGVRPNARPAYYLPDQVMHFAPLPDPEAVYRGMSWITPVIREIQADTQMSRHKLKFFENGASPNLAVSLPKELTPDQFRGFVEEMDAQHRGVENAYKTLYTGGGADVTVIGANMQQMDFRVTQGAGESRLALAAGVHPVVAGLSEGLAGSSLNVGNYSAARRQFVDTTVRHLWANVAGSAEVLVPPPADARLWYDARDIPFLREDEKDAAEIQQAKATTIRTLIDAGFVPDSVVSAVEADDRSLLVHSGLYSVQLQPPGSGIQAPPQPAPQPGGQQP